MIIELVLMLFLHGKPTVFTQILCLSGMTEADENMGFFLKLHLNSKPNITL